MRAKQLWRLLAPLGWIGVLWQFSAQDAPTSGDFSDRILAKVLERVSPSYAASASAVQERIVELFSFWERKAAHMSLYFVLALLFDWALRPSLPEARRRVPLSLGLCALAAALDEYHQTFVSGRSGEVRDVLVDCAGALLALVLLRVLSLLVSGRLSASAAFAIALLPAAALPGFFAASLGGSLPLRIAFEALRLPVLCWFLAWGALGLFIKRAQRFAAR